MTTNLSKTRKSPLVLLEILFESSLGGNVGYVLILVVVIGFDYDWVSPSTVRRQNHS
jgi:hypothetical protein